MPNPLPQLPPRRVFVGARADARAQQFGLPDGTKSLVQALRDGASSARMTTAWHPRSYRGQKMWGETFASANRTLTVQGVVKEVTCRGVEMLTLPAAGRAIVVTAGDIGTGEEQTIHPRVRYERRKIIKGLVNRRMDVPLWGDIDPLPEYEVWFLLHYLTASVLRGELSQPLWIDDSGWVTSWGDRIILPETQFGGGAKRATPPPDIDVDVQRRAG